MSKGRCPNRAGWRFEPGKPVAALSPHYRLDCDHGAAIMALWETGGSEPVYLCEQHAEEQKLRREKRAEAARRNARATADGESCGSAKPKSESAPETRSPNAARENSDKASPVEITPPTPAPAAPINSARKDEALIAMPASPSSKDIDEMGIDEPHAMSESANTKLATSEPEPVAQATAAAAIVANPPSPAPTQQAPPVPAAKTVRPVKDAPVRLPARDLTFGNPAKAIVDEAIWNLPAGDQEIFRSALQQGKSAADAAQAAGGQLAAIHRRIAEYSVKADAILSTSAKSIGVHDVIDSPLEQAMIEIIESDSMTDPEKDAAIQQLGALQEWAKYGLQTQFTPFEAHRGLLAIGERMNWGGPTETPERLRPAYRALYTSLKKAIHAAVPDAQELHERAINLRAAKSDLLAAPVPELQPR